MKKKSIIELIAIYIILTALSYAFYLVLVAVEANDAVASALLSWSATMFATIALLYTFYTWREQKGSEVIADECNEAFKSIIEAAKNITTIARYLKLKPSREDRKKFELELNEFEVNHHKIIRSSLFIDATIVEDGLTDKIYEYDLRYKEINALLLTGLKFYGRDFESKIDEYLLNYLQSTKSLTEIYKPYALYKKTLKLK